MAIEKDVLLEKEVIKPREAYDYFNASNFSKPQAKTSATEKELNRFKNDYDTTKLNRVYEKYNMFEDTDVHSLQEEYLEEVEEKKEKLAPQKNADFNKLIREQNTYEELEDTLTYKKVERNPKVQLSLNAKTKRILFTYTFVSVMLLFLLVYNVFSIADLNKSIGNLNNNIASEQINIERIIKDIGNMTDEDNVLDVANDLSFKEIPVENVITVNLYEKQTVIEYKGQTNWFDSICKFLNNLFGG